MKEVKGIIVGLLLVLMVFVTQGANAGEVREYTPNTVTVTTGVGVGTVDDVAVLDTTYYQVTEEDVGADDTYFATERWLVAATEAGTFPDDMETINDVGVAYTEVDDDNGALTGGNAFLLPEGIGTYTAWTPLAGANWQMVDDDPPHDFNTTYVYTSLAVATDTYVMEDVAFVPGGGKVAGTVTTFAWVLRDGVDMATNIQNMVITHSTNYQGNLYPMVAWPAYKNFTTLWAINPNSGVEWTLAEINAMEVGLRTFNPNLEVYYATSVGAVVPFQYLNLVLDVRHNITGVPLGRENYLLTIRALTTPGEDMTTYVYDHVGLGWDATEIFTTNVYLTDTYVLTDDHISGAGEVWIMSVDFAADTTIPDDFVIDYMSVRAWDVEYTFEFSFDWIGLPPSDTASQLTVVGYRSVGETMTLEVMRTGVWFILDANVLGTIPGWGEAYDLAPADLAANNLQIRFTDNVPTDNAASVAYIDFLSVSVEVKDENPASPIDVYVDIDYDLWTNEIKVRVWWVQTGGPEPAVEIGKWITLETDGQALGVYEVGNGTLRIDAPWDYFDSESHNITGIGAVNVYWDWLQSTQTYYSDAEFEYISNFPRFAVLMFGVICIFSVVAMIAVKIVKERKEDEEK